MKISMRCSTIVVLVFGLLIQNVDISAGSIVSKLVNVLSSEDPFQATFLNNKDNKIFIFAVSLIAFYRGGKYIRKRLDNEVNRIDELRLNIAVNAALDDGLMMQDDLLGFILEENIPSKENKILKATCVNRENKFKITDKMLQDVVLKKMDINVPNLHQRPELEMVPGLECEDVNQWAYYRIAENKRTKYLEYENNRTLPEVRHSNLYNFTPVSLQK